MVVAMVQCKTSDYIDSHSVVKFSGDVDNINDQVLKAFRDDINKLVYRNSHRIKKKTLLVDVKLANLSNDPWEEMFKVQSEDGKLEIIANNSFSSEVALFFYLQEIGVRKYLPHKKWEYFPTINTLKVKNYEKIRPKFAFRQVFSGFGVSPPKHLKALKAPFINWAEWLRFNNFQSQELKVGGHYGVRFNINNKIIFEENARFRAEVKGKRVPYSKSMKVCMTYRPNIDLMVKDVLNRYASNRIKGRAFPNYINIDPTDGQGFCTCRECKALGSISNLVFHFANEVATSVADINEDIIITHYAYAQFARAPTIAIADNIKVYLADFQSVRSLPGLIQSWKSQHSKNILGLRTYWGNVFGLNNTDYGTVNHTLDLMQAEGLKGIKIESGFGGLDNGLLHYMLSRLLWRDELPNDIINEIGYNMFPNANQSAIQEIIISILGGKNGKVHPEILKAKIVEVKNSLKLSAEEQNRMEDFEYFTTLLDQKNRHYNHKTKDGNAWMDFILAAPSEYLVNKFGSLKKINRDVYKNGNELWSYGRVLKKQSSLAQAQPNKTDWRKAYNKIISFPTSGMNKIGKGSIKNEHVQYGLEINGLKKIKPRENFSQQFRKKLIGEIVLLEDDAFIGVKFLKIHPRLNESLLTLTLFNENDELVFETIVREKSVEKIKLAGVKQGLYKFEFNAQYSEVMLDFSESTFLLYKSLLQNFITHDMKSFYIYKPTGYSEMIIERPAKAHEMFIYDPEGHEIFNTKKSKNVNRLVNVKNLDERSGIYHVRTNRSNFKIVSFDHMISGQEKVLQYMSESINFNK